MQHTRTWILIADAQSARALASTGPASRLEPVSGMNRTNALPKTSDIMSDRQGRSFESTGGTRHPMEPRSDPREQLKTRFAQDLVHTLDAQHAAGAFDRLVMVAPPHFLGDLRAALTPRLKSALHGDIDKDLTKVPDNEIRSHLGDIVV
ncbi:MAG TPA: host attachment protein [Hyphomicrobiaceae bacterium]|jgi:protein required for attachment to host cells|nr:host attachment protein [Hyphomicrobiaceae bacterium]